MFLVKCFQEVLSNYEILRAEFPSARIMASTLDDFFLAVEPIKSKLPVIEKEIGDTWLQGISSDPRKQAEYRAVSRKMDQCIKGMSIVTYFVLFFCSHSFLYRK